ncbi:hypothetical protein SBOR_8488 [Sclerotinia borealis F-4128]|uniref:EthD domain-containing protein n=1 Tax=Sclerotinia borealis (strain F-4128) TaxID=1432307 RepID=W9C8C9_SCLBF|nr:hypothetical protein SBOR_8488 [Sclerotinia borealis F-4128]
MSSQSTSTSTQSQPPSIPSIPKPQPSTTTTTTSSTTQSPRPILALLKRNPSLTKEEFSKHWFERHAQLVVPYFLEGGGVEEYVQVSSVYLWFIFLFCWGVLWRRLDRRATRKRGGEGRGWGVKRKWKAKKWHLASREKKRREETQKWGDDKGKKTSSTIFYREWPRGPVIQARNTESLIHHKASKD